VFQLVLRDFSQKKKHFYFKETILSYILFKIFSSYKFLYFLIINEFREQKKCSSKQSIHRVIFLFLLMFRSAGQQGRAASFEISDNLKEHKSLVNTRRVVKLRIEVPTTYL